MALAFFFLCGGPSGAQSHLVVGLVAEALAFRSSGAAIYVASLPERINGAQCDALASLPGIGASGALRTGSPLVLAAMPSTPVTTWEATPGFHTLLTPVNPSSSTPQGGVWVASDLANRAGLAEASNLVLTDSTIVPIGEVYQWPTDGRSPKLSYQIITPVASVGAFDECWVLAWPDIGYAATALVLPILPGSVEADGKVVSATFVQLNTTLGNSFDASAKMRDLPLKPLELFAVAVALGLGFLSVRIRRLELASALHAGASKSSLGVQICMETLLWSCLGAFPAASVSMWMAQWGNTSDWFPAFFPALLTLTLAVSGTLFGALLGLFFTQEKDLFRYFKQR